MIIFVIMKNLQICGYLGEIYDALFTAFIIILFADLAVMAYLYRSYFGRSVLHELSPDVDKKSDWYYDPETHKYSNHLPIDLQLVKKLKEQKAHIEYEIQSDLLQEQIDEAKEARIREEKTRKIVENKNELRAAIKIQRWWRQHLYEPGRGVVYLKAKQHFESQITNK